MLCYIFVVCPRRELEILNMLNCFPLIVRIESIIFPKELASQYCLYIQLNKSRIYEPYSMSPSIPFHPLRFSSPFHYSSVC